MNEIWKNIIDYDGKYAVSSFGNVKALKNFDAKGRLRQERPMILSTNEDGYLKANLSKDGKQSHKFVHQLVQKTFNSPIPKGYEVNHKNGIRNDNRPENLEVLSHADNIFYSKNVLKTNYATYGNARMTKEQRDQIFYLRSNRMKISEIAVHIGFSKSQIGNVLSGKCWHI